MIYTINIVDDRYRYMCMGNICISICLESWWCSAMFCQGFPYIVPWFCTRNNRHGVITKANSTERHFLIWMRTARQPTTHGHCGAFILNSWWRHLMETFSAILALSAGNSPVTGEFPAQRPVTQSFDVFFDLRLNKRLSKQSWGKWFETLPRLLWRHCNVMDKEVSDHHRTERHCEV